MRTALDFVWVPSLFLRNSSFAFFRPRKRNPSKGQRPSNTRIKSNHQHQNHQKSKTCMSEGERGQINIIGVHGTGEEQEDEGFMVSFQLLLPMDQSTASSNNQRVGSLRPMPHRSVNQVFHIYPPH